MSEVIINPDANMCDTLGKAIADLFKQLRTDGVVTGAPKTQQDATDALETWVARLKGKAIDPADVRAFTAHVSEFPPAKWPPLQAFFEWKATGTTKGTGGPLKPAACLEVIPFYAPNTTYQSGVIYRVSVIPALSADVWESEAPEGVTRMSFKAGMDESGQMRTGEHRLKVYLRGIEEDQTDLPGYHLGLLLGEITLRTIHPDAPLKACPKCGSAAVKVHSSYMQLTKVRCGACSRATGWVAPGEGKSAESLWNGEGK